MTIVLTLGPETGGTNLGYECVAYLFAQLLSVTAIEASQQKEHVQDQS